MVLTPRNAALREPLRHALQRLEAVVSAPPAFDAATSERTFSLGANANAGAIIGTRLIQRLRKGISPGTRLALRAADSSALVGHLEAGDIDIALVSQAGLPKGLPHQPLLYEKFMMAQRKRHPRGERKPTLRDYARLDHVVVSGDGGGFRSFIDDILQNQGYQRRVVASVQYYGLVPLILETTDLVCTLPARFLSRYADRLVSFELPFDAGRFTLFATWHARFDADPAHRWFREQLLACASD